MSLWTVETLNAAVDAEVAALPIDLRARLVRMVNLIGQVGLDRMPAQAIKHLDGKLWEIRLKAASGISRAIYVTASGRRVIIVRVFVKKSQATPRRELDLAHARAKEVR